MSREFRYTVIILLSCAVLLFQIAMKEPPDREIVRQLSEWRTTPSEWLEQLPPDLRIDTLAGGTFVLSEAMGSKVIILNFFATWCGPCAAEIPEFNRYFEEHHTDGVVIVGIDVNEQEHVVRSFVERHRLAYPVGLDPNGEIARNFDVSALPTTIVVGTDGRVKLYETGAIANSEVAFDFLVHEQLQSVRDEPRITPDLYRSMYAQQGHPGGRPADRDEADVELTGRAFEIASRIRCPSCGDPVITCDGTSAKSIKHRLASMNLENMSDGEILAELFLIDGSDR